MIREFKRVLLSLQFTLLNLVISEMIFSYLEITVEPE